MSHFLTQKQDKVDSFLTNLIEISLNDLSPVASHKSGPCQLDIWYDLHLGSPFGVEIKPSSTSYGKALHEQIWNS